MSASGALHALSQRFFAGLQRYDISQPHTRQKLPNTASAIGYDIAMAMSSRHFLGLA